MLYFIGLYFALCAGKEHRNLCFVDSQLSLHTDIEGKKFLRYIEDTSKNRQGGLKHRKITPKQVDAYENTVNPARCIVAIYEAYISHRPDAKQPSITAFYLQPLAKPVSDVWFSSQPLGENDLSKVVAKLCERCNLKGLRASAASRLYQKGFDEQLICETTGHRSNALQAYKSTSDGQKRL